MTTPIRPITPRMPRAAVRLFDIAKDEVNRIVQIGSSSANIWVVSFAGERLFIGGLGSVRAGGCAGCYCALLPEEARAGPKLFDDSDGRQFELLIVPESFEDGRAQRQDRDEGKNNGIGQRGGPDREVGPEKFLIHDQNDS